MKRWPITAFYDYISNFDNQGVANLNKNAKIFQIEV